jgi:hypothetical protein
MNMLRIALHLVVHLAWTLLALILLVLGISSLASAAPYSAAIVMQDRAVLRAAPRESAQQQALLWQGDTVEIRGRTARLRARLRPYARERAGFVRVSQVRRVELTPGAAPELLSVVRFLRDGAGSEALGVAFAAAYIEAAHADMLAGPDGVDALDALATLADRLARQMSSRRSTDQGRERGADRSSRSGFGAS